MEKRQVSLSEGCPNLRRNLDSLKIEIGKVTINSSFVSIEEPSWKLRAREDVDFQRIEIEVFLGHGLESTDWRDVRRIVASRKTIVVGGPRLEVLSLDFDTRERKKKDPSQHGNEDNTDVELDLTHE